MSPNDLAQTSHELLIRILNDACQRTENENLRSAFIYRHTRNIADLGGDVITLITGGRVNSARIVVRSMLESLFKIGASLKIQSFPEEKLVAEIEEEISRITTVRLRRSWK